MSGSVDQAWNALNLTLRMKYQKLGCDHQEAQERARIEINAMTNFDLMEALARHESPTE